MLEYRVFMTRTRTIKEHAVVMVRAASHDSTRSEAARVAANTNAWDVSVENTSKIDLVNIQEL